ncbi:MAG: hypothetical protein IT308_01435 [Anaerolineaceae bacterium]|nr:hypothetical protein [Anaerolineaceae bacterium]
MSAPQIWIGFPLLLSAILFVLRKQTGVVWIIAIASNILFALLAFFLPAGRPVDLGLFLLPIEDSLVVLGRRFILDGGDRQFLGLIFALGAFWFGGGRVVQANRNFVPLGMTVMALLAAALAVEPFLYAALLVEMAVLVSVPILSPPGQPVKQGLFRFLIFQTLAMPFILIAGWAAGAVEANPAAPHLLQQAVVLLALGFAFWLAVFPFYNWMPLLVSQTNPFVASFIVLTLNTLVFLLSLDFLDAFSWLRSSDLLYPALRLVGTLMVVTAGIWTVFQQDLTRVLAYTLIMENGFSLLALSLNNYVGFQIFASMFLARWITIALFSLSLTILAQKTTPDIQGLQGFLYRMPLASLSLLGGLLGMGGAPLLAVFPLRLFLLENLSSASLAYAIWPIIGMACILIFGLRVLVSLVESDQKTRRAEETRSQAFFLTGGLLFVFMLGIFPRWFLPSFQKLLETFAQLK